MLQKCTLAREIRLGVPRERVGSGHDNSSSYCFTKSALFIKSCTCVFLESDVSRCLSKSAVTAWFDRGDLTTKQCQVNQRTSVVLSQ